MKGLAVGSLMGLMLFAPSAAFACGMYYPRAETKTIVLADALDAIDAVPVDAGLKKEADAANAEEAEVKVETATKTEAVEVKEKIRVEEKVTLQPSA